MKKLLFSFVVLPGALAMAQVGVNTNQPDGSFDVAYIKGAEGTKWGPETPQGVHFPNVSTEQRSKFKNVREGMIIYNTNKKCLEMYLVPESGAPQWECILNVGSEASQGVAVSPASFSGQFIGGVELSGASVSFEITNNGFSPITVDFSNAVTVENEGITVDGTANNSVSLKAGESKTLTYKLSGTPKAAGQLKAIFSKLGLSAEQVLTVDKGIADLQDQEYYVLSLINNDIKEQSYINNTSNQISLKIPYTNGKGSYDAINIEKTTAKGQGGDTKQITLSISAGKFSQTGEGELTATLKVKGDEIYQVRQLEPGEIYEIATYDIDISGRKSKVIIKGIGVIPDRKFKEDSRHQFVYLPVTVKGAKGYNKTWLNYNLGAEYAKATNFKPQQQLFGTDAHNEAKTYGSYYQWQRASDGHEFWNSGTTPQKADTWTKTGKAAGKFITGGTNWVEKGGKASGANLELWQAEGANNPCPSGYHVPTEQEWLDFHEAVTDSRTRVSTNRMYTQTTLPNLAVADYRNVDGSLKKDSGSGIYWSSSDSGSDNAHNMYFSSGYSGTRGNNRTFGFSVRCIKSN